MKCLDSGAGGPSESIVEGPSFPADERQAQTQGANVQVDESLTNILDTNELQVPLNTGRIWGPRGSSSTGA